MQFHWINSNEKYHEGAYRKWIAHGFGFTHGDSIYGRKLEVFQPGDLVFMYVDDMGIKTVGTVIKEWDGIEYHEPIISSSGVTMNIGLKSNGSLSLMILFRRKKWRRFLDTRLQGRLPVLTKETRGKTSFNISYKS